MDNNFKNNIFDEIEDEELMDVQNINYNIKISVKSIVNPYKIENVIAKLDNLFDNVLTIEHYHMDDSFDDIYELVIYIDGRFEFAQAKIFEQILYKYTSNFFVNVNGQDTQKKNLIPYITNDFDSYNDFVEKVRQLCKPGVRKLDLTSFDVSGFKSISLEFLYEYNVKEIDITGWDTSECQKLCFRSSYSLKKIKGIENLDVSNIISAANMFDSCQALKELDLEKWNLSKCRDFSYMFFCCEDLEKLKIRPDFVTKNAKNLKDMFGSCWKLESLDVKNWDVSNVKNMDGLFARCQSLTNLDIKDWNTSKVTNMDAMFTDCKKLNKIECENWNVENVKTMYNMFMRCGITSIDLKKWNPCNLHNAGQMFHDANFLQIIDITGWNTPCLTNMSNMFSDCDNLMTVHAEGLDTSNVIYFNRLFFECRELRKVDCSSWNLRYAKNVEQMFNFCDKLS